MLACFGGVDRSLLSSPGVDISGKLLAVQAVAMQVMVHAHTKDVLVAMSMNFVFYKSPKKPQFVVGFTRYCDLEFVYVLLKVHK